ncbi:MAG: fumarylacetoacetate hydrolase family protein [Ruthenibacterium lactatiformans]
MKLATFEVNGEEKWGFLAVNPRTEQECIVVPHDVEAVIPALCRYTSYFELSKPCFIGEGKEWPKDLQGFLEMGEPGMELLRKMERFVHDYAREQDLFLIEPCFYPLDEIRLKSPIPRPRVYWGLVQNCPSFFRNDPKRYFINLYPQGHERTQASCVGQNGYMVFNGDEDVFPCGFTIEMGVIIGKRGKYIPASRAMEYVAGYTNVIDAALRNVQNDYNRTETRMGKDWYIDATASWIGKKMDTMGAMGPYLTTKDEVLNPYDLLCYSKQDGKIRDRGFSGEMVIGIERAIEYYSSFAELRPGDVFHMGAMQVDGMRMLPENSFGPENCVEVGIEKVGDLRVQFIWPYKNDWRPEDDPTRAIHPADAVRDLYANGTDKLSGPEAFDAHAVRHFWISHGNYEAAEKNEGLMRITDVPRMLNNPGSFVSDETHGRLARRATTVKVGIELCAVIGKVAYKVTPETAHEYILGYSPLAVMNDQSLLEDVAVEFSNPQERNIPLLYARWGDGYNVMLPHPIAKEAEDVMHAKMHLKVDGIGEIDTSTEEYIVDAEGILVSLTKYLTLFPGDVVSLGRISTLLEVPADIVAKDGIHGTAGIEGLGELPFHFVKDTEAEEAETVREGF